MSSRKNRCKVMMLLMMLVLIGILFAVELLGKICPAELISKAPGEAVIMTRDSDLLVTGVSQIVSDDGRVYVLFGSYSVVQVYTHEGKYLHTISVYNQVNGRTEIAAFDNQLYIRDKSGNVYVFDGNTCAQYISREELEGRFAWLPYGASDPAYSVRWGSVWKTAEDGTAERIIQRPFILFIYQNSILFMMRFLLYVMSGFVLYLPLFRKRK